MTAAEAINPGSTAARPATLAAWRRAIVFGTGFGIVIGDRNLDVAIVQSRPSKAKLIAAKTIRGFRTRPAAEWGAELTRFLGESGQSRLAATVLLPRDEVIVRTLALPGVSAKDTQSAIELQIDTLHPYGDDEVVWSWSPAGPGSVLVGLVRKASFDAWETLFAEAGISMAAVTFSAAVIHSALRIWNAGPASLLCYNTDDRGRIEVYGESEARAVYSAEFSVPVDRALAVARAELRLAPDHAVATLTDTLPEPRPTHVSAAALAYAAAVAGSVPHRAKFANLLPPERRASHDRLQYLIPAALALLLIIALLVVFAFMPAIEQKRYRDELDRAGRRLEPSALRAQSLERSIAAARSRIVTLDQFRGRTQADLDALNELTRLLPPPVWTNSVEIYPDSVVIAGEADQAAPLLKLLDSSPLFQNSEFALSVSRNGQTEQFRIRSTRRGRAGRATP
jgi:Tfp pilus assembly protein PilN